MDDMTQRSRAARSAEPKFTGHRAAQLGQAIAALEENLAILEDLQVTLAAALLDNAIAEARKRLTNES